ncbi:cation:proton antiporter [Aquibium microcysteis]|uniref:cation:proton antiporter n=1 Tax=Aquibium microcysteis TaxID=675281 RepID=UPI00165D0C78|nr:cation:proton antiporter [Aquibium microcysteis]
MSGSETFLAGAVTVALALLCLSFLVTVYRVVRGPTLPDRIVALDMLVAVALGFIAVIGIRSGITLYIDVAIALGLVGFLATVAFARFVLSRGNSLEKNAAEGETAPSNPEVKL